MKKIYIASDHGGYLLKKYIIATLSENSSKGPCQNLWVDMGCDALSSCDYPLYAQKLCQALEHDPNAYGGVLICGSGIGMSIAANRYPYIRAALCLNTEMVALSRQHNNANVLCLGERLMDKKTAIDCVKAFLNTPFSEEKRHVQRLNMLR
jgi:ribose 5-phosphate isomerase B